MDVEFRTMSSLEKKTAQSKLNDYREELRQLQSTYSTSKLNAEAMALKGGGNTSAQRNKLLNSNQKLDQSTATLEQSRQILQRTQVIGDTVLTDLESQREQLQDAKSKVSETKDFTSEARQVLRTMGNRAVIHKICVIFTIIALAAAIVATGYYGVTKKK
jgi:vesicle transport through interaction with t-SNAREs 1